MEEPAVAAGGSPANTAVFKVPPQSVEAEQSVLGGLMLDNNRWEQVADVLSARDFYRRDHQVIFTALATLFEAGEPADVVTVSERLQKGGQLEAAGGLAYLGDLAGNTPSAANLLSYARIVRDNAILRGLIQAAQKIAHHAFNPGVNPPAEILDAAEKTIFDLSREGAGRSAFSALGEMLPGVLDQIDVRSRSGSAITGVATGFTDLDERTAGLQPADLVIVAGRPSMGKTSLALNIAENAALGEKLPVAIFSMEMPGSQLAMRMLASNARLSVHKLRTGKLDDLDWPRLSSASSLLGEAPIYIDDSPGLTPLEIRARARRLAREHENGLGMIVVDYLQLMQVGESTENRATEISAITRALKSLAKELDVPVVALSQLNRSVEQRPDKRPIMSDLRESGAIEQDADVILFIYRDEVYNEDSPQKGIAEIIIGKQRNGPTGKVRLTFLGEYTKFENYIRADVDAGYGY